MKRYSKYTNYMFSLNTIIFLSVVICQYMPIIVIANDISWSRRNKLHWNLTIILFFKLNSYEHVFSQDQPFINGGIKSLQL